MIKMYIEFNNADNGLLLTDGNSWMYLDASEIAQDISRNETAADNVRSAIETEALYSADDLWEECFDEEHHIADYDGMTLDDIDRAVNKEGHDVTTWEEI